MSGAYFIRPISLQDHEGNKVYCETSFIPSGVADVYTIKMEGSARQCALMILKEATGPKMGSATGPWNFYTTNKWGPFEFGTAEVKLSPFVYGADENTNKLLKEFSTLYKIKSFW